MNVLIGKFRVHFLISLVFCAYSLHLKAVLPSNGFYYGVQGGWHQAPNIVLSEYQLGYHLGGQLGWRSQTIRYEGELLTGFNKGNNFSGDTNLWSLMGNLYYDFICTSRDQSCGSWSPFISGGIGSSLVKVARAQMESEMSSFFSYQGKIGCSYHFTPSFTGALWYRYFQTVNIEALGSEPFKLHGLTLGLNWNVS